QWDVLMKDKVRGDRIFILKDGQLQPLPGVIGDIDEKEQTVKFKADKAEKEIEPPLEKLQGMQFSRVQAAPEGGMWYVVDVAGNKLVAAKLAYSGGDVSVTTPFGQKVTVDPKNVAMFDFNLGRLTFLSDMEEKMADTVLLGGFNPLRKNRNL